MKVNVSDFDFCTTSEGINQFSSAVSYMQNMVLGRVSDSKMKVSSCKREIESRINKWVQKKARLDEKISDLTKKISVCRSELERLRAELASLQGQLSSLRPPRTVTVTVTQSDGSTRKETRVEDPDCGQRESLQARIADLQQKIAQKEADLNKLESELRVVESDLSVVTYYLFELENASGTLGAAERDLAGVEKYVNETTAETMEKCQCVHSAVETMRDYIQQYNNKSYGNSRTYGSSPTLRVPSMSRGTYSSTSTACSRPSYSMSSEPEKKRTKLSAKMKWISDTVVEIVGVYEEKEELKRDVILLDGTKIHLTLRIKKPVGHAVPCLDNLKDLTAFLSELGYHPKVTAMGTRYADAAGNVFFLS